MGGSILTPEPIQALDFRRATESDVDGMADAHRKSILQLGSQYYAPAIVNEWAAVVNRGLYVEAMGRGEIFFIATGVIARHAMILGFSSDYVISGTAHGTSAYVHPVAARRRVASPGDGGVLRESTRRNRNPDRSLSRRR
jgi:hypothetical protein